MHPDCTPVYPSPEEFTHAAEHLAAYLRGTEPDVACAKHCAWLCQGYALSVCGPCPHQATLPDEAALADTLDAAAASTRGVAATAAGFDWTVLLPALVALLQSLLNR